MLTALLHYGMRLSHSILMYFMLPKSIWFKSFFFYVVHFVSSGNQISTFHWKWISVFMGLIGPT